MITEDYVSFETAELLKEKGFDWEVHRSYLVNDNVFIPGDISYVPLRKDAIRMPTLQMTMKWLREVHKIHISVEMGFDVDNHQYYFFAPSVCRFSDKSGEYESPFGEKEFNTCEEACEAAIKYCLENLIEI